MASAQRKANTPQSLTERSARSKPSTLEEVIEKLGAMASGSSLESVGVSDSPTFFISPFVYNYLKSRQLNPSSEEVGDDMDHTRPSGENWELVEGNPQPIKEDRSGVKGEIGGQEQTPTRDSGSVPETAEQGTDPCVPDRSGLGDRPAEVEGQEGPYEGPGESFWVSSASSSSEDEDEPLIFRRTRPLPEILNPRPSKRTKTIARRPRTRSSGPAIPMNLPAEKPIPSKSSTKPKEKSTTKPSRQKTKAVSGTVPERPSPKQPKKRPISETVSEKALPTKTPPSKKTKIIPPPSALYEYFLTKTVVRGKVVRSGFFEEHGLELFLTKLAKQGWLELFSDGTVGCSVSELAEFYANCVVTEGVVTSVVRNVEILFDSEQLGKLLGIPSEGFDLYVRENKQGIDREQTLSLCRKLAQKPDLDIPRPVLKAEMQPMHRLLYWFIIKNIIPRGQGRNKADVMDLMLVDLLDTGSQINLPSLMISHIGRMAYTARDHDIGYGFLLSLVFEKLGVCLQKRVPAQTNDEIGKRTLIGCGFSVPRGSTGGQEQPAETVPESPQPRPSSSSSSPPSFASLLADQQRMKEEMSALKEAVSTEQVLNAQRHEILLKAIAELTLKFPPSKS